MIYKGTTPTHTFEMPFDCENLIAFTITYAQNGAVVLKKTKDDCSIEENVISVHLTQEDTLLFNEERGVKIQLKVMDESSEVYVSDIITTTAAEVLDDEVLNE